jgi:hypothetical protein
VSDGELIAIAHRKVDSSEGDATPRGTKGETLKPGQATGLHVSDSQLSPLKIELRDPHAIVSDGDGAKLVDGIEQPFALDAFGLGAAVPRTVTPPPSAVVCSGTPDASEMMTEPPARPWPAAGIGELVPDQELGPQPLRHEELAEESAFSGGVPERADWKRPNPVVELKRIGPAVQHHTEVE